MKIISSTVLLFRVVEASRKLKKLNIPYDKTHYTYVHRLYNKHANNVYNTHKKWCVKTRLWNLTCDCASGNKL